MREASYRPFPFLRGQIGEEVMGEYTIFYLAAVCTSIYTFFKYFCMDNMELLEHDELEHIRKIFNKFDINGDGNITFEVHLQISEVHLGLVRFDCDEVGTGQGYAHLGGQSQQRGNQQYHQRVRS